MTARARLHHAGTCFWIEAVPGSNENLVTASAKIGPLIILEKLGFLELEILGIRLVVTKCASWNRTAQSMGRSKT
jgi:hypothetical protein